MLITAWIIGLLATLAISGAILGWGLAARRMGAKTVAPELLGLGLLTTASLLTGVAGGYNRIVQSALMLAGWAEFILPTSRNFLRQRLPRWRTLSTSDKLWIAFPALYFLTRFFTCGLPQQHSDPLYYHLLGPKLWAEMHQIRLTPEHPSLSQAALWETLYGIVQLWIGTLGEWAHIVSQISAQWLLMFWGQLASVLLGSAILKRLAPQTGLRPGLRFFVAWLCVCPPGIEWLGGLAKNDYILLTFVLSATLAMLEKEYFFAGVFVGFAYSSKVLAAWAILTLPFFVLREKQKDRFAELLRYGVGAGLAVVPILVRNIVWTKNPLFPNLDAVIGPHWINTLWINHNLSYGGGVRYNSAMWEWVGRELFHKLLPKIILVLGLSALVFENLRAKAKRNAASATLSRRDTFVWIGLLIAQFTMAILMLRPIAEGRYANYVAVLWLLFAAAAFLRVRSQYPKLEKYSWPALFLLGLLINTPIDELVKIPKRYLFKPATQYVKDLHPLYTTFHWIDENVKPSERVVFMAEKQNFYLDRPFETVSEMKRWEEILLGIHSADQFFRELKRLGYAYVQVTPDTGGYPPEIRPYWSEIVARRKSAVFESPASLIFRISDFVK
jgi:hypothetical protein